MEHNTDKERTRPCFFPNILFSNLILTAVTALTPSDSSVSIEIAIRSKNGTSNFCGNKPYPVSYNVKWPHFMASLNNFLFKVVTHEYLLRDSRNAWTVDFRWFPAIGQLQGPSLLIQTDFLSKNAINRKCVENKKKSDKNAYWNQNSFMTNGMA